jgi:hypothetical protein
MIPENYMIMLKKHFKIILCLALLLACQAPPSKETLEQRIKKIIKEETEILDPDSVLLRDIKAKKTSEDLETFCGEINSKNRFGGYTGWSRFSLLKFKNGKAIFINLGNFPNISKDFIKEMEENTCETKP